MVTPRLEETKNVMKTVGRQFWNLKGRKKVNPCVRAMAYSSFKVQGW